MTPYFVAKKQTCSQCGSDLFIENEAELYEDLLFCDSVCVMEYLYRDHNIKQVILTNQLIYRDVD